MPQDTVVIEKLRNIAIIAHVDHGKTTLVEILQGLRTPTSGTATVLGLDLQENLYEIKDRIGVVPQSFQTFERLTVKENVALMADLHSGSLAVADVLEELDLAEWANVPFESLSGGYQRRTGIAMALVSDPEILFLDEPTTGLDPAARGRGPHRPALSRRLLPGQPGDPGLAGGSPGPSPDQRTAES